jgi:hypothetical protein
MGYFLAISCVVSGWVMLRMMGSERTGMMKDMESQLRQAPQEQPLPLLTPPPTKPGAAPASKKPAPAAAATPIKAKH